MSLEKGQADGHPKWVAVSITFPANPSKISHPSSTYSSSATCQVLLEVKMRRLRRKSCRSLRRMGLEHTELEQNSGGASCLCLLTHIPFPVNRRSITCTSTWSFNPRTISQCPSYRMIASSCGLTSIIPFIQQAPIWQKKCAKEYVVCIMIFHDVVWDYFLTSWSAYFVELIVNARKGGDIPPNDMDPEQEAEVMHTAYYTNYGLALRGLVHNNHDVGKGTIFKLGRRILHFHRPLRFW